MNTCPFTAVAEDGQLWRCARGARHGGEHDMRAPECTCDVIHGPAVSAECPVHGDDA